MTGFRIIESKLKKVERTYNHLIAYLVSEANYHAYTLNEYHEIPQNDKVFIFHAIAYITNCKAVEEYKKVSRVFAPVNLVVCKHNLAPLIKDLTDQ